MWTRPGPTCPRRTPRCRTKLGQSKLALMRAWFSSSACSSCLSSPIALRVPWLPFLSISGSLVKSGLADQLFCQQHHTDHDHRGTEEAITARAGARQQVARKQHHDDHGHHTGLGHPNQARRTLAQCPLKSRQLRPSSDPLIVGRCRAIDRRKRNTERVPIADRRCQWKSASPSGPGAR
jgi:hypothetical protein